MRKVSALVRKKSTGTRSDSAATTPNGSDSDSDEDDKKSKSSRKTSKGTLNMPLLPQQLAMVARAVSEHRSDNSSSLEEENRSGRRTILPVLRLAGENVSLQKTPTENEQILLDSVNKLTKRVGHLELSAANLRSDIEMLLAERRANGDAVVQWKAFVANQQEKEGDTCNCMIDSCILL